MYPSIKLKAGRGNPLVTRHPWVFSGALSEVPPEIQHGGIVRVLSEDDTPVGTGMYSSKSMIAVRLMDFGEPTIDREWLRRAIASANDRRILSGLAREDGRSGYRVVFGESDWLPGLVVDRYADTLVMQLATTGMDRLREDIVAALQEVLSPKAVFERSDGPSRTEEGLKPQIGLVAGDAVERAEFIEADVTWEADITEGQKTGFFLDQRPLREKLRRLAAGRKVADLFSYTGGSGVSVWPEGPNRPCSWTHPRVPWRA